MQALLIFFAGLLFAVGLGISGMTDANKVIAFLDFTEAWDPSLAFVMVGAIGVHGVANRWIRGTPRPLFAPVFPAVRNDITRRLVVGATVFGVGWGIGGYCPGPGVVSVVTGAPGAWVFVATMSLGMVLHELVGLAPQRDESGQPSRVS
jgi:uncharacterized membrane protein YedE/YeeE